MVKYTSRVRRAFGRLLAEELEAFTRDRITRGVGRRWTMENVRDFEACVAWMKQEAAQEGAQEPAPAPAEDDAPTMFSTT